MQFCGVIWDNGYYYFAWENTADFETPKFTIAFFWGRKIHKINN